MVFLLSMTLLVSVFLCHASREGCGTQQNTNNVNCSSLPPTMDNMDSSTMSSSSIVYSVTSTDSSGLTASPMLSNTSALHSATPSPTDLSGLTSPMLSDTSTLHSATPSPTKSSGLTSPVSSGSSTVYPVTSSSGLNFSMNTTLSSRSSSLSSGSTDASSVIVLPTSSLSSEKPPIKDPSTNNTLYLSVGIAGGAAFACSLVLCGTVFLLFRRERQKNMSDVNENSSTTIELNTFSSSKTQTNTKLKPNKTRNTAATSLVSTNEDQHNDVDEQKVSSKKVVPTYEEVKPRIATGEEQIGQTKTRTVDHTAPSEALYKSLDTAEMDYTHMYSVVRNEMFMHEPQVVGVEVDGKVYAVVNKRYTNSQNQYASLDQGSREHGYETITCDKQRVN